MRKRVHTALLLAVVAVLAAAAGAFAHGPNSHQVLGTVKAIHLVVVTPDGKQKMVELTPQTIYEKAGKRAAGPDVKPGARVSIQLTEDNKRAVKVKIGETQAR